METPNASFRPVSQGILSKSRAHSTPTAHARAALCVERMLVEIGRLIDCQVELLARQAAGSMAYIIVPVDRKRLGSGFWQAVRADPCGSVWKSPEAACVGFAARSLRWLRVSRRQPASAVERFVRDQLGQTRAAPARHVITAAQSVGISAATLHRAATRLGVRRQKVSMTEGWLWTLPAEGEPKYSTGASDE
jgi:hypothetical protein